VRKGVSTLTLDPSPIRWARGIRAAGFGEAIAIHTGSLTTDPATAGRMDTDYSRRKIAVCASQKMVSYGRNPRVALNREVV
jgi:hypothetical protein